MGKRGFDNCVLRFLQALLVGTGAWNVNQLLVVRVSTRQRPNPALSPANNLDPQPQTMRLAHLDDPVTIHRYDNALEAIRRTDMHLAQAAIANRFAQAKREEAAALDSEADKCRRPGLRRPEP
jgi:hypothetical protein